MTFRFAILGVALLLLGGSCGGRTVVQETADAAQPGQPGQAVQPGQPGQAPSPSPTPTASCDSVCAVMANTCPTAAHGCVSDCAKSRTQATGCTAQFDAMLTCLQSNGVSCDASGDPEPTAACVALLAAFSSCGSVDTPTPVPPTPVPTPTPAPPPTIVPPSPPGLCPGLPAMPLGLGCTGGGSVGSGGGSSATSYTLCNDAAGNVWQSQCAGSACECGYNGTLFCQCWTSVANPYSTCCPGMGMR